MAERLNAAVSKTVLPLIEVTRVQIPPLPPVDAGSLRGAFLILGGHGFLHSWKVHYALKQAEHTCSTACSPMKTYV